MKKNINTKLIIGIILLIISIIMHISYFENEKNCFWIIIFFIDMHDFSDMLMLALTLWSLVMLLFFYGISICALILIFKGVKELKNYKNTLKTGEKCYAKLIELVPTGNFIGEKDEYNARLIAYVSSLNKSIYLETCIGFIKRYKYLINSYLEINYLNGIATIGRGLEINTIPTEILDILDDENNLLEAKEDFNNILEQKEEQKKEIIKKVLIIKNIRDIVIKFILSIAVINICYNDMANIFNNFTKYMPGSLILLITLIIHLLMLLLVNIKTKHEKIWGVLFIISWISIPIITYFIV